MSDRGVFDDHASADCWGRRAEPAAKDSEVVPLVQLWRMIWPQAILFCMMHIFVTLEHSLYTPFLYARVHCCGEFGALSAEYDVPQPKASLIVAEARSPGLNPVGELESASTVPACDVPPLPASSSEWSLSSHCVNKEYVEDSAQATLSNVKPVQKLVAIAILPTSGALADSIGRRSVLVGFSAMLVASCLLYAWESAFGMYPGDFAVLIAASLFGVCFQPKEAVLNSSIADIMGHDETNKNRAFFMVHTISSVIAAAANLPLYWVLHMHMRSYVSPWLFFAGFAGLCMVLARFAMPETLVMDLRKPVEIHMFNPIAEQFYAMRLIARDPVLVVIGIISFLDWLQTVGFITIHISYLMSVGFAMEDTLLPEMVAMVVQVPMSGLIFKLLPKIGAQRALQLFSLLYFAAFVFVGPYMIQFGSSGAYLHAIFAAAALSFGRPAIATIITERVDQGNQSKILAGIAVFGSLGILVGVKLFNRILFQATRRGMARAIPAFGGMAISWCCFLASSMVVSMTRTYPPPAAGTPPVSFQCGDCCCGSSAVSDDSSDGSSDDWEFESHFKSAA